MLRIFTRTDIVNVIVVLISARRFSKILIDELVSPLLETDLYTNKFSACIKIVPDLTGWVKPAEYFKVDI